MAKWNSKTCYATGIAFQMIVLMIELLPLGAVMIVAPGPGGNHKMDIFIF